MLLRKLKNLYIKCKNQGYLFLISLDKDNLSFISYAAFFIPFSSKILKAFYKYFYAS